MLWSRSFRYAFGNRTILRSTPPPPSIFSRHYCSSLAFFRWPLGPQPRANIDDRVQEISAIPSNGSLWSQPAAFGNRSVADNDIGQTGTASTMLKAPAVGNTRVSEKRVESKRLRYSSTVR